MYGGENAIAQNEDYSLHGPNNPAEPGGMIIVYMTGQGALDNPVTTGAAAPSSPLSRPRAPVAATAGGQAAEVVFAGLTPGYVGLLQVNLRVPFVPNGSNPLQVSLGGMRSNSTRVWVTR